ncbi:MAG: alkaline phosphatase, partial [Clostridia bacterium]|nr:alkaline phosphatase [Clostridia bacterium]
MKVHTFRIAKVILAVLILAVAIMAVPMFASAASNVECVKVTATGSKDGRFQFRFSQSIKSGDVITFYIKPHETDCNLEVRIDDDKFVNEKFGNGESVVSLGDGWYAVRAEATVSGSFWAIKVAETSSTGDIIYIRDIKINGTAVSASTAVGQCSDWYTSPTVSVSKTTMSVADSALTYDWSNHQTPGGGTYTPESFTGNLPTYADKSPYTWKINAALGGKTNLPAVNLAATGRYTNVTNVNDQLIAALSTTTFVDPNNMIFIISDGLGENDIKFAEHYAGNLIMNDMPYYGTSLTLSYQQEGSGNGWTTTDSAAAGTALSTGFKTRYYYEALDINKKDIPQITEVLRERFGKIIGVVTTGWAYDATPAVYGGAHAVRGDSSEIAKEMMTFAPDLFIGSGLTDYRSTFNSLNNQSIGLYDNWSTAIKSTKDKVWISTEDDSTSKNDDIRYSDGWSTSRPTISQMMAYSLTWLQAKSDKNGDVGFFLMFENGMTDDAGHNNIKEDMIAEVHATDETVAIALKFACENPDTIVIVTADHDTGGMTLNSGWQTDLSKCKFTTGGHSQQPVAVYAIGKNAKVFNNQQMYNNQVGKVTAYLMGLTEFGSTESTYSIDNIIAGIKNDVENEVVEVNRITGQVLHVRADAAT